jgi:CheY-like chemotaxis protein
VLGIVNQSGGGIWCQSELGEGTRFNILLPAIEAVAEVEERPAGRLAEAPKGSGEVILLVEDEDQVRKLTGRILRELGYVVLEARDGHEGFAACEEHPGKIDLILSDVIMPDLGGRGLADRIQETRPEVKVLFMSGHAQDLILKEGIHPGIPFLVKPFAPVDLARKVREVLGS